jgi:hypothetical protein
VTKEEKKALKLVKGMVKVFVGTFKTEFAKGINALYVDDTSVVKKGKKKVVKHRKVRRAVKEAAPVVAAPVVVAAADLGQVPVAVQA